MTSGVTERPSGVPGDQPFARSTGGAVQLRERLKDIADSPPPTTKISNFSEATLEDAMEKSKEGRNNDNRGDLSIKGRSACPTSNSDSLTSRDGAVHHGKSPYSG